MARYVKVAFTKLPKETTLVDNKIVNRRYEMAEIRMFNPIRTIGGKKYQMVGHGYDAKKDAEYMAKQYKRLHLARVVSYKSEFTGKTRYVVFVHYKQGVS